jgi:hypothetical protein
LVGVAIVQKLQIKNFTLGLGRRFLTAAAHSDLLAPLGAGISLRALAVCRQVELVAQTAVGVDLLEALDILANLPRQVTLYL